MLLIRAFKPSDAVAVASIILPIQRDEFGIAVTLDEQPDLSNISDFYQSGIGNFWVAEFDGTLVGTIGLRDIGSNQVALRKMFVVAQYRGQAHGVAQGLLDALVQWSKEQGATTIYLGTTSKFLAAHRFYEKNGFTEIAKSALPSAFPVMAVDSKFYCHGAGRSDVVV